MQLGQNHVHMGPHVHEIRHNRVYDCVKPSDHRTKSEPMEPNYMHIGQYHVQMGLNHVQMGPNHVQLGPNHVHMGPHIPCDHETKPERQYPTKL